MGTTASAKQRLYDMKRFASYEKRYMVIYSVLLTFTGRVHRYNEIADMLMLVSAELIVSLVMSK